DYYCQVFDGDRRVF
nr:immunoglobulin light chain junction region [Macaca mulatta]